MENRGPNEAQRPIVVSRKVTIVRGSAVEGDEPGIVETIEVTEATPDGLQETSVTRFTYCGGCYKAIKDASQIAARCVVCGAILCPACSTVVCSNEHCQKTACPSCRETWQGLVYCKPHGKAQMIKVAVGFAILTIVVCFVVLFLLRLIG